MINGKDKEILKLKELLRLKEGHIEVLQSHIIEIESLNNTLIENIKELRAIIELHRKAPIHVTREDPKWIKKKLSL